MQESKSQAAAAWKKRELLDAEVAAAVEAIKAEAKERKGGRPVAEEKPSQTIETVSRADRSADAQRAKLAGTNRQYMHDADVLADNAPDLLSRPVPSPS